MVDGCRLSKMEEHESFENEAVAQRAISAENPLHPGHIKSFKEYKRCAHCWEKGGADVIDI